MLSYILSNLPISLLRLKHYAPSCHPINKHSPLLAHLAHNLAQSHASTLIEVNRLKQVLLHRYLYSLWIVYSLNLHQLFPHVYYLVTFRTIKNELLSLLLIFHRYHQRVRVTSRQWLVLWKRSRYHALCLYYLFVQCVFEHQCRLRHLRSPETIYVALVHHRTALAIHQRCQSLSTLLWLLLIRPEWFWTCRQLWFTLLKLLSILVLVRLVVLVAECHAADHPGL